MSEYDDLIEGYDDGPLGDPKNDPGPLSDEENQTLEESVVPAAELEDEHGRQPCQHCGSLQYEGSPFCLTCGRDDPIPAVPCGHTDGWVEGCPWCEKQERLAVAAMGNAIVVDVAEITRQAWEEHDRLERIREERQLPPGARIAFDPSSETPEEALEKALEEPPPEEEWVAPPEIPLYDDQNPAELRHLRAAEIPVPGLHYVIYDGRPRAVTRGNYLVSENDHVEAGMHIVGLKDDGGRRARADRTLRMRYRGYLCGELQGL